MMEYCDIQKLSELFNPKLKDSDSEEELEEITATEGDNTGGTQETKPKKANPYAKIENETKERRDILDPEDIEKLFEEHDNGTQSDWKKTPRWDISYKQQVTASDVFLQMGMKSPSTASCEDMIITIHLPGERRQNMDLKITRTHITLVSPRFYLNFPLPQPVDPQKGNAKFDSEEQKLIVTLTMDRELDLVNF